MIRTIVFRAEGSGVSPRAALLDWLVETGGKVGVGDPLCEYEIDKAVAVFASPASGYLRRRLVREGGRFSDGDALALVSDSLEEALPEPEPCAAPDGGFDWGEVDNRGGPPVPLGVMRQTIAERMAMSKRHIPCFYLTATVDMTRCLELRAAMKKTGRKATINDMVIKASALALVRHPKVASVYTPEGLVPRNELHIGFAAVLPDDGLVVPVVKNVDKKGLADIADDTRRLAAKAKKGDLTPEDCSGGVFSVSYLGAYDVDNFVAIVNPGEAAIVAVGRTIETPVVVDGAVAVRPVVKLTLSCDHRSIDGTLAARVMNDIKHFLEDPETLL